MMSILLSLDPGLACSEINARGSELLGMPQRRYPWPGLAGLLSRTNPIANAPSSCSHSALASGSSREREFDVAVDGEPRRIYWRCIARREADGTPAGWLCSGHDVTDRARRDEDAQLAQERLTRVARMATLGEMAAGIAHELNQPLTAITTYARACEHYHQHAGARPRRAA